MRLNQQSTQSINMTKFLSILAISTILMSVSCKKKTEEEGAPFDKASMLTSLADEHIIPVLNQFSIDLNDLESKFTTFSSDKTSSNLNATITSWKAAYVTWQNVKIFDFGPVRMIGLKGATGTFPTDTVKVQTNINTGGYILSSAANTDAIGLPSLDFLLERDNALNEFINSAETTTYTLEVIQKMVQEVNTVNANWVNYRATFISSTGTGATSSFSELVNEFTRDYELCKNAKVGIPIGKQSLGIQMPEYLETKLSAYSFELLRANITALQKVYSGQGFNGEQSTGFKHYLSHEDRSSLASSINANFDDIISKIDSFNGTLEEEMLNSPAELDNLYALLQNQVVLIKTDMTSTFGVLITYQDNDGD